MKITVNAFLSLDGVMQAPGGRGEDPSGGFERGGWVIPYTTDDDFGQIVSGWFEEADAFLLGRRTFEIFRAYWPRVTDPDDRVARDLNAKPKFVVSRTLTDSTAGWADTTVIDSLGGVARLKGQLTGELQVHGSRALAHALHDAGLVDEYRLIVFPTVVGDGKRLFEHPSRPSGFTVVEAVSLTMARSIGRTQPESHVMSASPPSRARPS